ncbi:hypothetical protein BKA81DRAFT_377894 [Phyllosticta paracitricarpa]
MPIPSTPARALISSAMIKTRHFIQTKCRAMADSIRTVNWRQVPHHAWNWTKTHKYELVFWLLCPKPIYFAVRPLLVLAGINTEMLFRNTEVWIEEHPGQAALLFTCIAALCAVVVVYSPGVVAAGVAASAAAAVTTCRSFSLVLCSVSLASALEASYVAGSLAAATQSFFGYVPAGGVLAIFQSAAMGGYGGAVQERIFGVL